MISRERSNANTEATPKLTVQAVGMTIGPDHGILHVDWQLTNLTSEPIEILEGWLPHGRFLGERQAFEPALDLAAGESAIIQRSVRYAAEPGEIIENAFLNLRVRYGGQPWRVLTRMRVECGFAGALGLIVEAVTMHRIGFSEAATERGHP